MPNSAKIGPEEIESRFGFHKAAIEGDNVTSLTHTTLRRLFKEFATQLDEMLPAGRTKYLAFTELETASMWSHKALAESNPIVRE
jgi:hypothetical protein